MRKFMIRVAAIAVAGTMGLGAVHTVSAHDVHTFGKVTVALGWLHEPAFIGVDNAVQVLVKDDKGTAITSITDKDLTVDISLGSQTMSTAQLKPTADPDTGLGIPGEYEFHFIPTAPGNYTFHLKGTVSGQAIDDNVTASDKTFDAVQDNTAAEWPNKVPAGADVARKADAVGTRADAAQQSANAAASSASDATDNAKRALIVGIVGVVLGVAGVATGLLLRRRTA